MAVRLRKGTDPSYVLVYNYNQLRRSVAVATGVAKFHADVTSGPTTAGSTATTASALSVDAADATDEATGVTLANQLKKYFLIHMADTLAHKVADTARIATLAAVADATADASVITLATAIQTAYNAHNSDTTQHYTADTTDDSTSIVTAANARTSLNAIKAAYNTHIASAPAGLSINLVNA